MPTYARILFDQVNEVVVQVPGRSFPGAVLQGDQLLILVNQAEKINRWIMQNHIRELAFSENLYEQLKAAYDNCTSMITNKIIERKFKETGRNTVRIPKRRGGTFNATITESGIEVDNLGAQPFLPWQVFEEAVSLMDMNGGRAKLGKAMSARLGQLDLPFDSIEGHIASRVYERQAGDSVFRRIVPISNILIWAGICRAIRGELTLL
jgi:hypothetical protein